MPDTVLNTSVRGNADVRSMAPHSSDSTTNQSTSEVGRRTKTVIPADSTLCSDVGVQATPATMTPDIQSSKPGILPVTSAMIKQADESAAQSTTNDLPQAVTNTKEKTPMCLINELARYNKISHKYVLIDEKGPAHRKEFHVRLDLGAESYQATGTSIKRAQHAAAEAALASTKLKRPALRINRPEPATVPLEKKPAPVTPTVELNALAMKLGVRTEYCSVEPPRIAPLPHHPLVYSRLESFQGLPSYQHHVFMQSYRRHLPKSSFCVQLKIGNHEFKGIGCTRQQARHNAASKALVVLKCVPLQRKTESTSNSEDPGGGSNGKGLVCEEKTGPGDLNGCVNGAVSDSESVDADDTITKSEISMVHELALHSSRSVVFDVVHESGPPHLRTFITKCICGDLTTEGHGNSKKSSKKAAAQLMLTELKAIVTPSINHKQKVKPFTNKKKNRNLIKMHKADVEYGSGINPISRLIQIQQANKKKEPVYSLIMEHGLPRKREFIMQVECNDKICRGKGPNKKLAKRSAAEEMLLLMGYSKPSPVPVKSVLKSSDSTHSSAHHMNKHVTFSDTSSKNSKMPGMVVKPEPSQPNSSHHDKPLLDQSLAAALAAELLQPGSFPEDSNPLLKYEPPTQPLTTSREKLEHLAACLGFKIDFTDFPKGTSTNQCLTLVALQISSPQVYHGCAPTIEESHNKASLQALQKLASLTQNHAEQSRDSQSSTANGTMNSPSQAWTANGLGDTLSDDIPSSKPCEVKD